MADRNEGGPPIVLGVPRERADAEKRVALVPEVVKRLVDEGSLVIVERGAGEASSYPDRLYSDAGAEIVEDPRAIYERADVVLKVQAPEAYDDIDEPNAMRRGQVLIAFLAPLIRHDLIRDLRERGIEAFSMDAIPRTTRAQSMDALSSQSNLAGYKSVILAADALGKIFPLMMTAAGTITPARVLILGAGVAGLQAIGTARRLGAVVYGYDVRAVVKEQIESLGAKFVELDLGEDLAGAGGYARQATEDQTRRQQAELAKEIALADVVVTTALIPGRPAPVLITEEAVRGMKPGSVIVDLAGEMGGNCELSQYPDTIVVDDVTIMAPANIPSMVPVHASQVLARNIQSFLGLIVKDGRLDVNFDDDIVAGTAIVHDGEIIHELTRKVMGEPELAGKAEEIPPASPAAAATAPPDAAPAAEAQTAPEPPDVPDPPPAPPAWEAAATTDADETSSPSGTGDTVEEVAGDAPSEIEEILEVSDGGLTDPAEVFDDIDGTIGNSGDTRRNTGGQA
jgi:H+-translocating NAD(P) transhydrogenase subunit alpha